MSAFSFEIILEGSVATEEMANRLYEAGLEDGSLGSSDGVIRLGVDREDESLQQAIVTASKQVVAAGYSINRIEIESESINALLTA